MRARQYNQRSNTVRPTVCDAPSDASAPIVTDDMKAARGAAAGSRDRQRVIHKVIEAVICGFTRVWPGAGRIAALAWSHGAITGRRQRGHLRPPHVERFGEPMQQQHHGPVLAAASHHVKGEIGGGGNLLEIDHRVGKGIDMVVAGGSDCSSYSVLCDQAIFATSWRAKNRAIFVRTPKRYYLN